MPLIPTIFRLADTLNAQEEKYIPFVALKLKLEQAKSLVLELENIVNNVVMHKRNGFTPQRPGRISWARARSQIGRLSSQLEETRKQLYSDFGLALS